MKSSRISFEVDVEQYEVGKNMEDGFELWSDVVTKGWIVTDFLVKITREDGSMRVTVRMILVTQRKNTRSTAPTIFWCSTERGCLGSLLIRQGTWCTISAIRIAGN